MKKMNISKCAVIVAILFSFGAATACKNNASDTELNTSEGIASEANFQTEVPFEDVDVEVGDYKNIEVQVDAVPEVTDTDVDAQIEWLLQSEAGDGIDAVTPIKEGDSISIDFDCFSDGELMGDTEKNYYFKVGSGVFLEDKEAEFVGKCGGDTLELEVDYDTGYPIENLSGKKIVYKIVINGIVTDQLQQSELTDAYVATVSDCKTVEEFREMVRRQMEENAKNQRDTQAIQAIWEKLMNDVKVDNYPEDVRQRKIESYKQYDTENAKIEDMTLEEYVEQYLQMSMEEYDQIAAKNIDDQIKYTMAVQTIAQKEGLAIDHLTEDDWKAYAEKGNYSSVDEFKANCMEVDLIMQIEEDRVNDYLLKTVKITEVDAES